MSMSIYGRDALWDAATWAELDQAVAEEAKRVRVARRVFHTEDLRSATGASPYWVSAGRIRTSQEGIEIPEDSPRPFVEIAVPFRLTPVQVEAEATLHHARALARTAAKYVALAEDHIVFRGEVERPRADRWGVRLQNARNLVGLVAANRGPDELLLKPDDAGKSADRAKAIIEKVNDGISALACDGWAGPYALILGPQLYADASSRLHPGSEETPADRLESKLRHLVMSSALEKKTGLLISLAGDTTTIYTAGDACVGYSGETLGHDGAFHRFRVYERIRHVFREPSSIRFMSM